MRKHLLTFTFSFLMLYARADFISLIRADQCETIIEFYVEDDHIRVTFEIGTTDLIYFKELLPPEIYQPGNQSFDRSRSLSDFFNNKFIVTADGRKRQGIIQKQELRPRIYRASLYTGLVDTTSNISSEVFYIEIIYPLKTKPTVITITPPIEKDYQFTLANIGFIAYHKNIPVNDLRYLVTTETLRIDWSDPWYSKFDNFNLKRHHSSSLLSFLYIDPFEVRHEVLVRVKDLEYWIDMGYDIDDKILVEEQLALKDTIAKFLKVHNIVTIDGREVEPIIDRVHWVKWSLSGIQILEVPQEMDYSSAVIGVIFAYPHDSIAQEVIINWDMFTDRINTIPNVATDPVGPMPYNLQPNDNKLVWKNFLKKYKLPTISEASVSPFRINIFKLLSTILFIAGIIIFVQGGKKKKGVITLVFSIVFFMSGFIFRYQLGLPFLQQTSFSKPEANRLISQLLKNTYRAFDFREESDIYDKLAVSNDGELLSEVYIQTKKGMVLENQGGIQVKVKEVELLEVDEIITEKEGLAYNVRWIVKGDVGHWGHIHRRTNQYSAILNIKAVARVWKLSGIEIIEEKRL